MGIGMIALAPSGAVFQAITGKILVRRDRHEQLADRHERYAIK